MRIAILSLAIGEEYKKSVELCQKSKKMYCDKNNYDYIEDSSVYDSTRHPAWSKVLLILKYLSFYDYVVWMDADIIIMNDSLKLEPYIDQQDFILCIDPGLLRNTGLLFVKNTKYAYDLLTTVYNEGSFKNEPLWEQSCFNDLYNKNCMDLQSHCSILLRGMHKLNITMYDYKYGDLLIHFMGIRSLELLSFLTKEHCLFKIDGETDEIFNERVKKIQEKYK